MQLEQIRLLRGCSGPVILCSSNKLVSCVVVLGLSLVVGDAVKNGFSAKFSRSRVLGNFAPAHDSQTGCALKVPLVLGYFELDREHELVLVYVAIDRDQELLLGYVALDGEHELVLNNRSGTRCLAGVWCNNRDGLDE